MIMTKYFAGIGKTMIHVDRAIRKVQRVRQQQSVDGARRADDRSQCCSCSRTPNGSSETSDRERAGADAGDEVELQEIARAPEPLELAAEHPQREHVEEDVEQPPCRNM